MKIIQLISRAYSLNYSKTTPSMLLDISEKLNLIEIMNNLDEKFEQRVRFSQRAYERLVNLTNNNVQLITTILYNGSKRERMRERERGRKKLSITIFRCEVDDRDL